MFEYIGRAWLVEARLELRLDKDVVDFNCHVSRVKPRSDVPASVWSDIRKRIILSERGKIFLGILLRDENKVAVLYARPCRLCPSSPSISPPTTNTCRGRSKRPYPSAPRRACVPASCRGASTQSYTLLCAPRRACTPIRRKRSVMHRNRASTFRPRPSIPSANAPRHDRRVRHRTPSASCTPQLRVLHPTTATIAAKSAVIIIFFIAVSLSLRPLRSLRPNHSRPNQRLSARKHMPCHHLS